MAVRVRATASGYYGYAREPGDEFEIADKAHFSTNWMEAVELPKSEPKKPDKGKKAE